MLSSHLKSLPRPSCLAIFTPSERDSIYNLVERAGKKWAVYYSDDNDAAKFVRLRAKAYTTAAEQAEWERDQQNGALGGFFDFQTFFSAHAANGTLAQYVFIEPAFGEDHQP